VPLSMGDRRNAGTAGTGRSHYASASRANNPIRRQASPPLGHRFFGILEALATVRSAKDGADRVPIMVSTTVWHRGLAGAVLAVCRTVVVASTVA
jgi:hypothetical protein